MRLLIVLILVPFVVSAQIPPYYSNIDFTKSGDSLKTQLMQLISSTHTYFLDYTSNNNIDTWDVLKQSDLQDGDTTNVLLVYGYNDTDTPTNNDRTRDKALSCHTSGCVGLWNREHVFPQSKANPSLNTQFPSAGTDAHNLRASDGQMNSTRGNRSYEVDTGIAHITNTGNFYPGDEWRGDVARIIMYMFVRYQNQCEPINVAVGSSSFSPNGDMPNILLEWNALDSVSQYERNRNDIFYIIQGNRNPFIDNPYLATRIWNGLNAHNTWGVPLDTKNYNLENIAVYPTMTNGHINITYDRELTYSLYNIYGQRMRFTKIHNDIDISQQAEGMYFLHVCDNNNSSKVFKIILKK